MQSNPDRTVAQKARDLVDRLLVELQSPRSRAVIRYTLGSTAALGILTFGFFTAAFSPTRDVTFRSFNGLPALVHGGGVTIAGITAPRRPERTPRWWWFILVGWWAGLFWVWLAWVPLSFRSTVPIAMSMLAMTDAVLFLPKQRSVSAVAVAPPAPPVSPESAKEALFERVPISKSARFRILDRDGYRCRYCGRSALDGATLHIDHVIPVISGGTNEETNLVTACQDCNLGKGAQRPSSKVPTAV